MFALSGYLSGAGVVQNMAFMRQNQASMAGCFQGEDLTWKVFYGPYHTPMHGRTLLIAIEASSRHLSGAVGV